MANRHYLVKALKDPSYVYRSKNYTGFTPFFIKGINKGEGQYEEQKITEQEYEREIASNQWEEIRRDTLLVHYLKNQEK